MPLWVASGISSTWEMKEGSTTTEARKEEEMGAELDELQAKC